TVTGTVTSGNTSNASDTGTVTITDNDIVSITIGDLMVTEDVGTANVPVTLSTPSSVDTVIDIVTSTGTAGTDDYTVTTTTVTIPAGQTTVNVVIPVTDDSIDEPNETFSVNGTVTSGNTANTDPSGTVTITDNDAAPTVTIGDVSTSEDSGTVTVPVSIDIVSSVDTVIDIVTATGAAGSTDYTETTTTVTIPAGETTVDVTIPVIDDSIDEPSEDFSVNGTVTSGNTANTDPSGTVTITDNDAAPTVTIGDVSTSEDSGTVTVPVNIDIVSSVDTVIDITTSTGTAGTSDYTETTTTVTIPAGETTVDVTIPVIDDSIDEPSEDFSVNGTVTSGNTANTDPSGTVTITDNDAAPTVTIGDVSTSEDSGTVTVPVSIDIVSSVDTVIDITTSTGTAGTSDYTETTTTVTIPAGQTTVDVTIPVTDDSIDEPSEDFSVNGTVTSGNTANTDPSGTVTITDNDAAPTVAIGDVTTAEDSVTVTVPVSIDVVSSVDTVIDIVTATGTAGSADYTETTTTVTIPAGETTVNVTIPVIDDSIDEPNETFSVNGTVTSGNTANSDPSGTVTITDNDAALIVAENVIAVDPVNGVIGGTIPENVLTNDTLNDSPIDPTEVTLAPITEGPLSVNADGTVIVAPNTPAGSYTVTYQICEILNPTNCDSATVTVTVEAAPIEANDVLAASPVDGVNGGNIAENVLANDTLNGVPVTPENVTIQPVTTGPLTVNADGTVSVAAGTPGGTYTVEYTICEVLNPDNCDTASVTVTVIVNLPPVAKDDSVEEQPLGQSVTIKTVANDNDPEGELDVTSVRIQDLSGNPVTTLIVPNEGTWTVDSATGDITFTPEPGYLGDPKPVQYTVKDTTGLESNIATVTIDYEEPAAIAGTVWLDRDKDNEIDPDEDRKTGWTLKIKDKDGNVIATTVTDAQGNYSVTGLIPAEYTVEFFNTNGTLITTKSTGDLESGETLDLPLPVDPSGVVYDSTTREVLAGVTLQLVNSQGTPVDVSCVGEGQQSQVTTEDGIYAFDVYPNAHSSCQNGETYTIKIVSSPAGYYTDSTIIPPQIGVYDSDANEANCTVDAIANSNSCEVQAQPDAPQGNQDTTYFMDFSLSSGDSNVIFNHIPLDSQIARVTELDDDTVLLSKSANKKQLSVGDQLYYTIRAENTTEDEIDVDVRDDLPKGFKFVSSAAKLTRAGADNSIGTEDDIVTRIKATGTDPITFGSLTLKGKEIVQIGYILKVGTAATQGNAVNTVQVFASGSEDDIASNIATATVTIVADSVLDQSTLIGKVFHDRDGDGYQDPANVTGLTVKSDYFGWNSLHLGGLNGRVSVLDDPSKYRQVIRMPYSKKNDFKVTTQQGTVITIDNRGQLKTSHTGQKKKGLTAQDIRVTTRRIRGIPTQTPVKAKRIPAKDTDVLEITITNYGINEEGIPGVRLATVDGLLIETDGYGRYHLPDVDGGRRGWGKNFILKVDKSSLPVGARFTTENPRVIRVTSSALSKINFGIKLPVQQAPQTKATKQAVQKSASKVGGVSTNTVEVMLKSNFFETNSSTVLKGNQKVLDDIATAVKKHGSAYVQIMADKENATLSKLRANSVRKALHKRLGNLMGHVKVESK
uniref:Calx-beta domain-containing protein n=1 Tax=uncultured Cocleimonas sp. TaxID=1051587 RepID=UPI00262B90E6